MSPLYELIEPWLLESDSDDILTMRDQLMWLKNELYDDYEPSRYETFEHKLVEWVTNVQDDADRKSLFRLLEHLFFVGKQQFDSLCRAAYNDKTIRWIIDEANLDIADQNLSQHISENVARTWFCPITDSMRINSFLKLNGLVGHNHRPDWRSLLQFGDQSKIQTYVANNNIERLVMLEDFVGSGNQMSAAVRWAAETLPATKILLAPLVCCPGTIDSAAVIAQTHPTVTFAPTLSLQPELFLQEQPKAGEPDVFAKVRDIILRVRGRLNGWSNDAFGYEATGALVALYSNCPDNTLPIIHHSGTQWEPLFPRIRRS